MTLAVLGVEAPMYCRALTGVLTLWIAAFAVDSASAQVVIQPTPHPTVTAENERWYLNGDPIQYAGSLYFAAGPRVYFNANEMVRSGFFMGIPLYTRTTIEPYSVLYLPVGPGLMQPYEKPRTGPLAETSGSLPSSLRPVASGDAVGMTGVQAAGEPSLTTRVVPIHIPVPAVIGTTGAAPAVGSAARERSAAPSASALPRHTSIGGKPQGSNSIFVEFEGERWYKAGDARPIDVTKLSRAGTYAGVPVWSASGRTDGIIYIPVTRQGGSLSVPYEKKR